MQSDVPFAAVVRLEDDLTAHPQLAIDVKLHTARTSNVVTLTCDSDVCDAMREAILSSPKLDCINADTHATSLFAMSLFDLKPTLCLSLQASVETDDFVRRKPCQHVVVHGFSLAFDAAVRENKSLVTLWLCDDDERVEMWREIKRGHPTLKEIVVMTQTAHRRL